MALNDLPLQDLDGQLSRWRALPDGRPDAGWLRTIRCALGMRVRQFAKAAHVAPSTALAAEMSESRGDITLATLTRYAEVLGCELRYVLVPKKPLFESVVERAEEIARVQIEAAHHSMALEGQSTSHKQVEQQIAELRLRILAGSRSRLWV